MARKRIAAPFFDYRRKFSTPTVLHRFTILANEWGMTYAEVCSKLILEGLSREIKKIEVNADEIEEYKIINKRN